MEIADNPYLLDVCSSDHQLLLWSFLSLYRQASWNGKGKLTGNRQKPVVVGTVRDAASYLASAFRNRHQTSPLHLAGSNNMLPNIRALFKAYDNGDPAPKRQKAITPKLLRKLFDSSGAGTPKLRDTAPAVTADLVIGAFFFAKRGCEYTTTPNPGKTQIMVLKGVVFRSATKADLDHQDKELATKAEYVTITFVDQKNGNKMDTRTQPRTGDNCLCPVLCFVSIVQRILQTVRNAGPSTKINSIYSGSQDLVTLITSDFVRDRLRYTCKTYGGRATFSFDSHEIGNKSIRSGVAMALFLQNISSNRIMILGRWDSEAFLVYIRPQVLEWTNNMSKSMIAIDSFTGIGTAFTPNERRRNRAPHHINGSTSLVIPRFHLGH
jgi:hypothetical protein